MNHLQCGNFYWHVLICAEQWVLKGIFMWDYSIFQASSLLWTSPSSLSIPPPVRPYHLPSQFYFYVHVIDTYIILYVTCHFAFIYGMYDFHFLSFVMILLFLYNVQDPRIIKICSVCCPDTVAVALVSGSPSPASLAGSDFGVYSSAWSPGWACLPSSQCDPRPQPPDVSLKITSWGYICF